MATHPAGEKKPNDWGFYDMHGNVWEWCQDVWHDNYEGAPSNGSARTEGDNNFRVLRGGSWAHFGPDLRSSHRILLAPDYKGSYAGLRFVGLRVAAPVEKDSP